MSKNPPFVLVILDGFGLADPKNVGNAITPTTAPNIFSYQKKYPHAELIAHGTHVGLFPGQEGNSEAGHLNIGAGRIVKQDLRYISDAIADKSFYKNHAFLHAAHYANVHKSAVHVMGLLTDGQSAHAHPEHLYALLDVLHKQKCKQVYVHLFTDGRDSSPHAAMSFLHLLRKQMKPGQKIATIMGRYYGMDRNKSWERTEVAYDALVRAKGHMVISAEEAIAQAYNRGESDEYVEPSIICEKNKPIATVKDHDVIIFFNARSDRARQITKAFVQKEFTKKNPDSFRRKKVLKHIGFVAMTDFGPDLPHMLTAFRSPAIKNCLAKAIGEARTQLYISETEKYAHVTFFINGGYPEPINGEVRELVKSTGNKSYADHPQMSSEKVTKKILGYLNKDTYDFITVNFPNADMVGHTGNFEAAKIAVHTIDAQVKQIVDAVLAKKGAVLITADHGNAEQMINRKTEEMRTEHTMNPVPCILVSDQIKGKKLHAGILGDIAPTVLKYLEIPQPHNMTGKALY